jgi:arginase family enzyme
MSVRQMLSMIQTIEAPIVAADVVELNPRNDASGVSSFAAAKILRELLGVMIAQRGD